MSNSSALRSGVSGERSAQAASSRCFIARWARRSTARSELPLLYEYVSGKKRPSAGVSPSPSAAINSAWLMAAVSGFKASARASSART